MKQNILIGLGLVLGISLLASIFLFPVGYHLSHSTGIPANDTTAASADNSVEIEIIAYQNLSDRGKELYKKTLTAGGGYTVTNGEGAPEFPYLTEREQSKEEKPLLATSVIIKRPANDSGLPPADQPPEYGTRYEFLATSAFKPPLTAAPWMLRYLAGLVGVVLLAGSGYALYRNRTASREPDRS